MNMLLFEKALERLNSLESSVPKQYEALYRVFLEVLSSEGSDKLLSVRHNKFTFTEEFMKHLSGFEQMSSLQIGSKTIFEFVEYLKNHGYISNGSASYALKKPMRQINRYHHFLPPKYFYLADQVEDFEEYVLNELTQTDPLLAVYIALVYFEEDGWREEALRRASLNNFFLIHNQGYQCIIEGPLEDGFKRLKIFRIKKAYELMARFKEMDTTQLFDDPNRMKKESKREIERYFGKKISVDAIRNALIFNAMMTQPPAIVACQYKTVTTVPLCLGELAYLYPQQIPVHLLEIEDHNNGLIGQTFEVDGLDDYTDEMFTDTEFDYDLKIAPLFTFKVGKQWCNLLKTAPRDLDRETLERIKGHFEKAIQFEKDISTLMVLYYIRDVLGRIYIGKRQADGINITTFIDYIGLLRKHLFTKINDFEHIDEAVLSNILDPYKASGAALNSIKKLNFLVSDFLKFHNVNFQKYKINAKHIPKSLVFPDEIDLILEEIETVYKKAAAEHKKRYSKFYKYIILQYHSFVILGYYSGMRLNEIRTRRHADIIREPLYLYDRRIKDAVYSVDINVEGLKTDLDSKTANSFKTSNASRRVGFVISNEKHAKIFDAFLKESSEKNAMYLFKDFDLAGHSKFDSVMKLSKAQILNEIISKVTNRYATLHSLRHSYATWWFMQRIMNGQNFNDALLNFSIEIGHVTPDVTMRSYIHFELIEEVIAHERRN
jgi:integrase